MVFGRRCLSYAPQRGGLAWVRKFPVDEEEVPHREVGANITGEPESPGRWKIGMIGGSLQG